MAESPSEVHVVTPHRHRLETWLGIASCIAILIGRVGLNLHAQRHGVGLSPDSYRYIQGSRALLDGHGFSWPKVSKTNIGYSAITWWPPGYSMLLAGSSLITGLDVNHAARFLNGLLTLLAAATMGWVSYEAGPRFIRGAEALPRRSLWPAVVAMLLFGVSVDLTMSFANAWSEPPFILVTLLALWAVAKHVERPRLWLAILAGALAGMSYWLRYAGIVVLAHAILTTLVLDRRPGWRLRLQSAAAVGVTGALFVLALVIRNALVADAAIGREPIAFSHETFVRQLEAMGDGLRTTLSYHAIPVTDFLDVSQPPSMLRVGLPCLAVALGLVWVIVRRRWKPLPPGGLTPSRIAVPVTFLSFVVVYVLFLAFVIVFLDPAAGMNWRLLAPAHAVFIVGVVTLVSVGLHALSRWRWVGAVGLGLVVVATVLLVGSWADTTVIAIRKIASSEQAQEPRRARWPSVDWAYDTLPPGTWVISNDRGAMPMAARSGWFVMTPPRHSSSDEEREAYSRRLRESGGAVVWWHMWRRYDELWAVEMAEALDLVTLPGSETWPAHVLVPREMVDQYAPGTRIGSGKQGLDNPTSRPQTLPSVPK